MRIAVVAPLVTPIAEPQIGGSQALLSDIAAGLARRGHDVSVFAASGSSIDAVRMVDTGIDPETLRTTLFRADGASDDTAAADAFGHVYGLLDAEAFDVVHNHAFDAPAIALAPSGRPVVHTLHLPPRGPIAEAIAQARARSRSVVVAAVSRYGAATWQELADVDVVLPNGVPTDRIPYSPSAGARVLFAGRISPEKGVLEAVETADRAGVEIAVVGPRYDEDYAQAVEGRVPMLDPLPRPELWGLMGESAAVLCPAKWDEPFGLVAAEAQACGTPVIAFARGALGEVVRDGETGSLVSDVDEAVDALASLDVERSACRRHAEADLSLERTLDAHEALYSRLVR